MNQEVDPQKYEIISQIRSGSFGSYNIVKNTDNGKIFYAKIYFAKILFDSDKSDRKTISTKEYTERIFSFVSEVEIQSQLIHPSIIRYCGFSKHDFNGDQYPIIFTEYPINGTLRDILYSKKAKNKGWNETKRFICIYGIAAGMAFLHKKKIIHFNLSPDNVLLDNLLFPKISEFVSAQQGNINKNKIKFDSLLYTAPEIFVGGEIDEKVDVYSFGIMLNEIYSKKQPYEGIKNPFVLQSKIANNFRPEIPSKTSLSFFQSLIVRCWHKDPKERPSFSEILETLNNETFINNKKLKINSDDFLSYVEYVKNAEKAYESNPNQVIDVMDFIKNKSKSELKPTDTNQVLSDFRKRQNRRFTLHTSKSKIPVIDFYDKPERKKESVSADVSDADNESSKIENNRSDLTNKDDKNDKSEKTDKEITSEESDIMTNTDISDEPVKSVKKDKTVNSDKKDKSDKKDENSVILNGKANPIFPYAIYTKLSSQCKKIIDEAQSGNQTSLKNLVNSLIDGNNGFPKDIELAVKFLKEGIKQGNTASMISLGDMYRKGEYLPQNYRKAISLYQQVIDLNGRNVSRAWEKLYEIQFSDDQDARSLFNEKIDYKKAKQISKEKADAGNVEAMVLYAKICMKEKNNGNNQITRELNNAFEYLNDAANQGSAEAMALYGQLLGFGFGIKKGSKEEILELYKKSKKKGSYEGKALYGYSEIVNNNNSQDGLKLIIESKEENNSIGMNAYGMVIFNGFCDFIPDEERGLHYIKLAAEAGNANALYNYARCLEMGRGVSKNAEEAIEYYKKSFEEGCLYSSFYLGNLLTNGDKDSKININTAEGKKYSDLASKYNIIFDDPKNLNLLL